MKSAVISVQFFKMSGNFKFDKSESLSFIFLCGFQTSLSDTTAQILNVRILDTIIGQKRLLNHWIPEKFDFTSWYSIMPLKINYKKANKIFNIYQKWTGSLHINMQTHSEHLNLPLKFFILKKCNMTNEKQRS